MQGPVVTLGEARLRLSPGRGERLDASRRLDVHIGGSESNVAVVLAGLGVDVTWLSVLPATPLGRFVARELRSCGVDMVSIR